MQGEVTNCTLESHELISRKMQPRLAIPWDNQIIVNFGIKLASRAGEQTAREAGFSLPTPPPVSTPV